MKSRIPTTKDKVAYLLSYGFNCTEIAIHLDKHPVTIRRIKYLLKKELPYCTKKDFKNG